MARVIQVADLRNGSAAATVRVDYSGINRNRNRPSDAGSHAALNRRFSQSRGSSRDRSMNRYKNRPVIIRLSRRTSVEKGKKAALEKAERFLTFLASGSIGEIERPRSD